MAESSSDDENGFNNLFAQRTVEVEVFHFNKITVTGSLVTFEFQFCEDVVFESQLYLDKPVGVDTFPCLFAIGMCVCSWYWMGFNTKKIIICSDVCRMCKVTPLMLPFWTEVYRNVALEFALVNKTELNIVEIILEKEEKQQQEVLGRINSNKSTRYSTLIPIGGKLNYQDLNIRLNVT